MVDPSTTLASARRLQTVMAAAAIILGVAVVVLAGLALSGPVTAADRLATLAGYGAHPLGGWQVAALLGVVAVHALLWIGLLSAAAQLFGRLAQGRPAEAAGRARRIAGLLWVMLAWGIASQVIVSLASSWGYPPGDRSLAVALGTPQISVAFAALIASFLAQAFALGSELWQDHREVI